MRALSSSGLGKWVERRGLVEKGRAIKVPIGSVKTVLLVEITKMLSPPFDLGLPLPGRLLGLRVFQTSNEPSRLV
jgi:hypothetical protein